MVMQTLVERGILDDPWLDGHLRLDPEPLVLPAAEAAALAETATSVLMLLDHLVPQIARRVDLQTAIGMDASLQEVAALDAPRWLGLTRVDVFQVEDGPLPMACEVNADTPTGLAETTELAAVAQAPGAADPSARLGERWVAMVRGAAGGNPHPVVGVVDATEMTEDLGHVRLLCRWLTAAGCTVVRGSPFNLMALPGQRVGLFGTPCDVLVRHYKTDWWARRRPLWSDEPAPPDAQPLRRPLALIAEAMAAGTVAVVNLWGAALAQSKRTLALPWEEPGLVPADLRAAIAGRLPETRFLESVPRADLERNQHDWVLKSDVGCEGEDVLVGREVPAEDWRRALALAMPGRWCVQRAFRPRRNAQGDIANHGIYTIGGLPSGIYTRRSRGPTDCTARACPTLVAR